MCGSEWVCFCKRVVSCSSWHFVCGMFWCFMHLYWWLYACIRPGVAQRVSRGITLLFHDRGTRWGWVVSRTPRPHFTPGKDQVPILQEAGWAPGPVWTGGKSRPHRDSIPDRPARSQSLYRLSNPAHNSTSIHIKFLNLFAHNKMYYMNNKLNIFKIQ